jgi:hypothetical protein
VPWEAPESGAPDRIEIIGAGVSSSAVASLWRDPFPLCGRAVARRAEEVLAPLSGRIFAWRVIEASRLTRAFSANPSFFPLPRAALRADNGPFACPRLSCMAPSALALRVATHVGRASRPCRLEKTFPNVQTPGAFGAKHQRNPGLSPFALFVGAQTLSFCENSPEWVGCTQ